MAKEVLRRRKATESLIAFTEYTFGLLVSNGIIEGPDQIAGVDKVLDAAAWTFVAAADPRRSKGDFRDEQR